MNSEVAKWTYRCSGTSLRNLNLLIFFWYSLDKFDEKADQMAHVTRILRKIQTWGFSFAQWKQIEVQYSKNLFICFLVGRFIGRKCTHGWRMANF